MSTAEKAAAVLEVVTRADVETMPPAKRQRLAALCRHVAGWAEPQAPAPKAGVLADVRRHGVHAE
jgi:hypothetical protein